MTSDREWQQTITAYGGSSTGSGSDVEESRIEELEERVEELEATVVDALTRLDEKLDRLEDAGADPGGDPDDAELGEGDSADDQIRGYQ